MAGIPRLLMHGQGSAEYPDRDTPHVALLEYDERFSVLEGFVHYDFHAPLKLPRLSLPIGNSPKEAEISQQN